VKVRRIERDRFDGKGGPRLDVPRRFGAQVRVADVLRVDVVELRERWDAKARAERGAEGEAAQDVPGGAGVRRKPGTIAIVRVGAKSRAQAARRGRCRVPGARELGEKCAMVAAVAPEIRGRNRLATGLDAERERASEKSVARGHAKEPGDGVMEVLVERRVVPLEDEVVVVGTHERGRGQRPTAERER
jgi:hypothetical protein